jgi:hypothetical protein
MRKLIALTAGAVLAATPALAAQKLGARTQPPEQVLAQLGEGSSDAELQRAVAAASAFPLGSLQNPVRVGGPQGARDYLARLRCADGKPPSAGAAASGGVGGFGSVVERYEVDCGAAAPGKVQLLMDLYHQEHREKAVPPGF